MEIKLYNPKKAKPDAVYANESIKRPGFSLIETISTEQDLPLVPVSGHLMIPRSLKDVPTNIVLLSSISAYLGHMISGLFDTLTITTLDNDSDLAIQQWILTSIFSASDADTVAWTSGTLKFADGQSYSISSGNTGNISALTYIYFDKSASTTVLQTTTTYSNAVGNGKVLIGIAKNVVSGNCTFQIFGGSGGIELNATVYTDENAQDAVGGILDDSGDVDFTYDDATPKITGSVKNDAITYAKMQNVSATDKILGRSSAGSGDIEEIACTSAGRAILDDANAAAQRATLGLGTIATENQGIDQSVDVLDGDAVHTHHFTFTKGILTAYSITP